MTEPLRDRPTEPLENPVIGTLNEGSIHDALKHRYAADSEGTVAVEHRVENFVADVWVEDRQGGRIVEIQTSGFGSIRRKLEHLLDRYPVTLVHPIAARRYIVKLPVDPSQESTRRRSPKRGRPVDVFAELVYAPTLLDHPNLELDIVLTDEDEIRVFEGKRRRRRKGWQVAGRRLNEVVDVVRVASMRDLVDCTLSDLASPFTTASIAEHVSCPRRRAQQIAYCLRESGLASIVDKRGNALVYSFD